jgi:hypothetical protein
MPRYAHRAGGSDEVVYTTSPIYSYGVDTGDPAPPTTDKYPAEKWTGVLPSPRGEKPTYYDDRTPARSSESGAHLVFGAGPTAAPGVNAPRGGFPLDQGVKQGIPNRNRFSRQVGYIGGGAVEARGTGGPAAKDRGVAYTNSKGERAYRGRSG